MRNQMKKRAVSLVGAVILTVFTALFTLSAYAAEKPEIAAQGADISMHGHTHGEQFPLTYLPFSFMNDMMSGLKQFGDMTAFTTQGAGGWGFHFKFPAKCEVAKVTINIAPKSK